MLHSKEALSHFKQLILWDILCFWDLDLSICLQDEGDEKEDKDEDEEEEEDGWMVPHGYLSEDEGCEQDEEVTQQPITWHFK